VKAIFCNKEDDQVDDEEIIGLFWERSESAIGEVRKKYGRLCRSISFNILQNAEDTDECLDDAYLKLWDSIPPQRPRSLSAYVCTTARNVSYHKYRYNRAEKRNTSMETLFSELQDCVPAADDGESDFDEREVAAAISRFLRTLGKEQRVVFVRRYWYSQPVKEIAAACGFSESKTKQMLFRTRNRLREYLMKEGIEA